MNKLLKNILITIFAISALFWGILPHEVHCYATKNLSEHCIPHWIHLVIGILSFLLAVFFANYEYITNSISS